MSKTLSKDKLIEWLDVEIDLSSGNDLVHKADRWAFRHVKRAVERGTFDTDRWISVEERLPDEPGYYLTYSLIGGIWVTEYGVSRQNPDRHFRDNLGFPLYPAPTHWMPLPEPPRGLTHDQTAECR